MSQAEAARVIQHVAIPVVASRVPGDVLAGGFRSRSSLTVAADRGWFDLAAKWAVDVIEHDQVTPAPSSGPTKTTKVRLFFLIFFRFRVAVSSDSSLLLESMVFHSVAARSA